MHRRITGRLVIATHNPGKLAEMRELLARHGVAAVSAGELNLPEPEETGRPAPPSGPMRGSRRLPAAPPRASARLRRRFGLAVRPRSTAQPGIHSGALGRPHQSFAAAMAGSSGLLPGARRARGRCSARRAIFVSALCVAWLETGTSSRSRPASTARWCGRRAATAGFGYDPMFRRTATPAPSAR